MSNTDNCIILGSNENINNYGSDYCIITKDSNIRYYTNGDIFNISPLANKDIIDKNIKNIIYTINTSIIQIGGEPVEMLPDIKINYSIDYELYDYGSSYLNIIPIIPSKKIESFGKFRINTVSIPEKFGETKIFKIDTKSDGKIQANNGNGLTKVKYNGYVNTYLNFSLEFISNIKSVEGLPKGITFNKTLNVISGKSENIGVYSSKVLLSDGNEIPLYIEILPIYRIG